MQRSRFRLQLLQLLLWMLASILLLCLLLQQLLLGRSRRHLLPQCQQYAALRLQHGCSVCRRRAGGLPLSLLGC